MGTNEFCWARRVTSGWPSLLLCASVSFQMNVDVDSQSYRDIYAHIWIAGGPYVSVGAHPEQQWPVALTPACYTSDPEILSAGVYQYFHFLGDTPSTTSIWPVSEQPIRVAINNSYIFTPGSTATVLLPCAGIQEQKPHHVRCNTREWDHSVLLPGICRRKPTIEFCAGTQVRNADWKRTHAD